MLKPAVKSAAGYDPDLYAYLIERVALHAERPAYAALFAFFAPRVKTYLLRTGLAPDAAEAAAVEAMIAVWRQAHRFDRGRDSAADWIFRIARNQDLPAPRPSRSDAPPRTIRTFARPKAVRPRPGVGLAPPSNDQRRANAK
jgi:hypothetical protein